MAEEGEEPFEMRPCMRRANEANAPFGCDVGRVCVDGLYSANTLGLCAESGSTRDGAMSRVEAPWRLLSPSCVVRAAFLLMAVRDAVSLTFVVNAHVLCCMGMR